MKWICVECGEEAFAISSQRRRIVARPCGHSVAKGPWKFYDLIRMEFTKKEQDKPLAQLFSVAQDHKEKAPNLIYAAIREDEK